MPIQDTTYDDRAVLDRQTDADFQRTPVDFQRTPDTRREWRPPQQDSTHIQNDERLAKGLGWFSIGLGLAEILMPRRFSRFIGVPESPMLMPMLGVRELAAGIGILANPKPSSWVWSRVAGDMMDLALLGAALGSSESDRGKVSAATAAVLGVTALDIICSQNLTDDLRVYSRSTTSDGTVRLHKSVTINRPQQECFRFWHDFQNLPRFMAHLESVQMTGDRQSHWIAKGPAGSRLEWDAETTEDRPDESISWRSTENSSVYNSGTVRFEAGPAGRGTILRVDMEYKPPAGVVGAMFAKLFGEEPEQQIAEDLRRYKQILETGEIPTTEGQSSGRGRD